MRVTYFLSLLLACSVVALVAQSHVPAYSLGNPSDTSDVNRYALEDIEAYEDLDYGFFIAVPTGWNQLVLDESNFEEHVLEPGYSVGFESPSEGDNDQFSDYLLIEILPGDQSDSFVSDGSYRKDTTIDGMSAWTDKVFVNGFSGVDTDVDLTVYQAEIKGVGFTVGIYVIGESRRSQLMSSVFSVLLRTFEFLVDPYLIA